MNKIILTSLFVLITSCERIIAINCNTNINYSYYEKLNFSKEEIKYRCKKVLKQNKNYYSIGVHPITGKAMNNINCNKLDYELYSKLGFTKKELDDACITFGDYGIIDFDIIYDKKLKEN